MIAELKTRYRSRVEPTLGKLREEYHRWQSMRIREHHRAPWREAITLGQWGELTAQWLEGTLPYQPWYGCVAGPDEMTDYPEFHRALIDVNRAGALITHGSQPGCREVGFNGATWTQYAFVEGFCGTETLWRCITLAKVYGLVLSAYSGSGGHLGDGAMYHYAPDPEFPIDQHGMVVTFNGPTPWTSTGHQMDKSYLDLCIGQDADEGMADVLHAAWQVCLIDPEHSRNNRITSVLRALAEGRDA